MDDPTHADQLAIAAQLAGEERLEELFDDDDECNCVTCLVRETLEAAWPLLLEAAREEIK